MVQNFLICLKQNERRSSASGGFGVNALIKLLTVTYRDMSATVL